MQIESILIFIAFVVITSFANKRKEAQQKQRQQQKREAQAQSSQVQTQPKQVKQQKPVKRTLQDLFREMQQEMETEYNKATEPTESKKKQVVATTQTKEKTPAPFTYESISPRTDASSGRAVKDKKPTKPNFVKGKTSVYENEIKDQPGEIGFEMSEEAILNGIIFSEVIGKPKAMR